MKVCTVSCRILEAAPRSAFTEYGDQLACAADATNNDNRLKVVEQKGIEPSTSALRKRFEIRN